VTNLYNFGEKTQHTLRFFLKETIAKPLEEVMVVMEE
jgi:hypothetical protein